VEETYTFEQLGMFCWEMPADAFFLNKVPDRVPVVSARICVWIHPMPNENPAPMQSQETESRWDPQRALASEPRWLSCWQVDLIYPRHRLAKRKNACNSLPPVFPTSHSNAETALLTGLTLHDNGLQHSGSSSFSACR